MCKCWLLHYRICVNVPMWECGLRSSPLYEGFHRLPYLKTPFGDSQMCKATNPHLSHQLRRQPLRRQEAVTEWTDGGTNTVHLVCGNVKMLECGPRPHNLRARLLDFTNVQPHKPTFKPSTKASATSQAGAVTEWTDGGTNTVHLVCGNVKMLECGPRQPTTCGLACWTSQMCNATNPHFSTSREQASFFVGYIVPSGVR